MMEMPADILRDYNQKTEKSIFFSTDNAALTRLREMGHQGPAPQILDFRRLLAETDFPAVFRKILSTLEKSYNYPVDIEFTANFNPEGNFRINLLQCRPLQTKGLGIAVSIPQPKQENVFFSSEGNFMGGNVRLPLDYIILVKAEEYLALPEREKYQAARLIGALNQALKGSNVLLAGPGRWGTTTPSLGVPVHFSELRNMIALCEVSYRQGGLMPELSFGSHFFQDIVEQGIFYAAIFEGEGGVVFRPELILNMPNILEEILPKEKDWAGVVHLAKTDALTLYSDITSQKVLCCG
jgi:hypothetical protein